MSEVKYDKPKMKFVDIRSREKMAFGVLGGNCWSQSSSGEKTSWYYNTSGPGYIRFERKSNCSDNVVYEIMEYINVPEENREAAAHSWLWKLDPYKTPAVQDTDLIIELSAPKEKAVSPSEDSLLRSVSAGFFEHQVFRRADGSTLWRYLKKSWDRPLLIFTVSADWNHITLAEDNTETAGALAFEYLGQIMPCVLLKHDALTFHGVLMEHEGRGIIISADSGTGKTTHARLWRDLKRAFIINGDRAAVQKVSDTWTGYGLPWSGTSEEQMNRTVPLTALVVLEQGECNEVQRLTSLEAFGAVWPHAQYPNWDRELTDKMMGLLDDFLAVVPVIRLRCLPNADAAEVLNQALEEL